MDGRPLPAGFMAAGHAFEQFADAINSAFALWDLSHLHEFAVADGRKIGVLPFESHVPDVRVC